MPFLQVPYDKPLIAPYLMWEVRDISSFLSVALEKWTGDVLVTLALDGLFKKKVRNGGSENGLFSILEKAQWVFCPMTSNPIRPWI